MRERELEPRDVPGNRRTALAQGATATEGASRRVRLVHATLRKPGQAAARVQGPRPAAAPIALTLFKGAPAATRRSMLPTIGVQVPAGPARSGQVARRCRGDQHRATAPSRRRIGGRRLARGRRRAKVAAVLVATRTRRPSRRGRLRGLNMIRADAPEPTREQVQRTGNASPKSTRPRALTATSRSSVGAGIAPASASSQTRTARGVDAPKDVSESAARTGGPHSAAASGEPSTKPSVGPPVEPSVEPPKTESDTPTGHDGGRGSTPETPSAETPPLVVPPGTPSGISTTIEAPNGATSPAAPAEAKSGCPGEGTGPGNGSACGLAHGYDERPVPESPGSASHESRAADDKPVKDTDAGDAGKPAKP